MNRQCITQKNSTEVNHFSGTLQAVVIINYAYDQINELCPMTNDGTNKFCTAQALIDKPEVNMRQKQNTKKNPVSSPNHNMPVISILK